MQADQVARHQHALKAALQEADATRCAHGKALANMHSLEKQLQAQAIAHQAAQHEWQTQAAACKAASDAKIASVEDELRCALHEGAVEVGDLQQQLQGALRAHEDAVAEAGRRAAALAAAHAAAVQARSAERAAVDALVDARAQCTVSGCMPRG